MLCCLDSCFLSTLHQALSFAPSTSLGGEYHDSPYPELESRLSFQFQLGMDTWGCSSLEKKKKSTAFIDKHL